MTHAEVHHIADLFILVYAGLIVGLWLIFMARNCRRRIQARRKRIMAMQRLLIAMAETETLLQDLIRIAGRETRGGSVSPAIIRDIEKLRGRDVKHV